MGCRVSTGLAAPVIKHSAAREEIIRFLPRIYTVPYPHAIPPNKPAISTRGMKQALDKEPHTFQNLPTNTSHNLIEPSLHWPRKAPKDWTIVFVLVFVENATPVLIAHNYTRGLSAGGPGCGKGTQCQRMVQDFEFLHLSAGDLLREEVKKGTPVGQMCEKLMKEGALVPLEITLNLLENAMSSSTKTRFLIDGFPRAIEQAKAFEKKVGMPDKVLFLECPQRVMEERLLKRGEMSGRVDDTPEAILKRFETFTKESMPVAAYYEKLNPNVVLKVSSVPPPDLVYKEIYGALKAMPQLHKNLSY